MVRVQAGTDTDKHAKAVRLLKDVNNVQPAAQWWYSKFRSPLPLALTGQTIGTLTVKWSARPTMKSQRRYAETPSLFGLSRVARTAG
eukprot:1642581-Prymnesium_polylepis.1